MTEPAKRIRITVGGIQLEAELKSTKTAGEVYAALPVQASINTWGEEFYFKISGVKDYRETATTQVKVGDVAYWGAGQVLAIFFGRTNEYKFGFIESLADLSSASRCYT